MAVFLSEKRVETTEAPGWVLLTGGWAVSRWDRDLKPVLLEGPDRPDKFSDRKRRPALLLPTLEKKRMFLDVLVWINSRARNLALRREPFMPGFHTRWCRAFVRLEIGLDDFIGYDVPVAWGSSARAARELSEADWEWPEGRGPCWGITDGKPAKLRREIQEFRESRNARLTRKRA